jgi:hypothetical protein
MRSPELMMLAAYVIEADRVNCRFKKEKGLISTFAGGNQITSG